MKASVNRSQYLFSLDLVIRCMIGGVFIFAAIPKFFDLKQFSGTIGAYGLVPDEIVPVVAVILPCVEIVVAIGLFFNRFWSKAGSALLLLIFIAVLSYGIWLGLDIDCGCFGPEDPEHDAFGGLRTALVRDLIMLICLGYSFMYSAGIWKKKLA